MIHYLLASLTTSAGPKRGELLSVTVGMVTSTHIWFDPTRLKRLHSFLVAAEAACSRGDLPVTTVEAKLVAVTGLATAAEATAVPAVLEAAVPEAPMAAIGATQALRKKGRQRVPTSMPALVNWRIKLLASTSNVKHSGGP